jgi:hypothetical protein
MALSPFGRIVAIASAAAALFASVTFVDAQATGSYAVTLERQPAPEVYFPPLPEPPAAAAALEQPAPSARPAERRAGRVALRPRVGCRLTRAS